MKTPVLYPLLGAWLLSTAMAVAPRDNLDRTDIFPGAVQPGESNPQYNLSSDGFDGPKVSRINNDTYDWWSIATFANDSKASAVVNFFMATSRGFPLLPERPTVLTATISGTDRNGMPFGSSFNADQAVIETRGNGSSGDFEGTGFSWKGNPQMTEYVVTIEKGDINGSLTLKSVGVDYLCPLRLRNAYLFGTRHR